MSISYKGGGVAMPRKRTETGVKAVPRNAANARERTRQVQRKHGPYKFTFVHYTIYHFSGKGLTKIV